MSCGSAIILKSGFVKVLRASRRSESVIGAGGVKKQGFVCAIVIGPLCLVDDFKIRFCESTPRRQEIRIRFRNATTRVFARLAIFAADWQSAAVKPGTKRLAPDYDFRPM